MYKGELISLSVAISWTVCAMFAEVASKRMGSLALNVLRMVLSLIFLAVVMLFAWGSPYPVGADAAAWGWLLLSGLVGYVIGDYFLFSCYILCGSRIGQLLMTLAPIAAAFAGWAILGEGMGFKALLGMTVTVSGILLSLSPAKGDTESQPGSAAGSKTAVSSKGLLFGAIAGICQGIGLVLSAKGIDCYIEAVSTDASSGLDASSATFQNVLPFAATFIRAAMGLVGFLTWTLVSGHGRDLSAAVQDKKGMAFALGATLTGPFLGVSLSLMATMYTSTGIAQTIMAITPVLIIFPTWFFFGQKIRPAEILGAVIAVAGVSLFFI